MSSGNGPTQACPIDQCYEGCCLATGLCPSSSCTSSVGTPNDSKAHCDKDCQEKTNCYLFEETCKGPHCMGIVECINGQNDCAGRTAGDVCIYSGKSKNYHICDGACI